MNKNRLVGLGLAVTLFGILGTAVLLLQPPDNPTRAMPTLGAWSCSDYVSADIPKDILDHTTVTSTVSVATTGYLVAIEVTLSISHTYDSDLTITLIAPNSSEVVIVDEAGGSGENFVQTVLYDGAATSIDDGTAPFTGDYSPSNEMLPTFRNLEPSGVWSLRINDDGTGDEGTLNSWQLRICTTVGTVPPTLTPSPTPRNTTVPLSDCIKAWYASDYTANPALNSKCTDYYGGAGPCSEGTPYPVIGEYADCSPGVDVHMIIDQYGGDSASRAYEEEDGYYWSGEFPTIGSCQNYQYTLFHITGSYLLRNPSGRVTGFYWGGSSSETATRTYMVHCAGGPYCYLWHDVWEMEVDKWVTYNSGSTKQGYFHAMFKTNYGKTPCTGGIGCIAETGYTLADTDLNVQVVACGDNIVDLTPVPTSTPAPDLTAWISEVLPRPIPTGTPCTDWNLRSGCGVDDSFVEVGVVAPRSLAFWSVDIKDPGGSSICIYDFKWDNYTSSLKVTWQDIMEDGLDGACSSYPITGTVYLYDSDGVLRDTRAYTTVMANGNSWAALDWSNPSGSWAESTPSPGH